MMKLLPYIFLLIFITVITLSVIYLSSKFAYSFEAASTTPYHILFTSMILFSLVGTGAFINAQGFVGHFLFQIATILMGFYLYLVLSVIVIDLAQFVVKMPPISFGMSSLVLAIVVSGAGIWKSSNINITNIEVPVKGLTEELKAVHLTDIHIGHFRTNGFIQRIIKKTNAEEPEIVFFTGDYLDSKYALDLKFFEPLKQLNAPVYFVDGNHDKATNTASIKKLMREVGVNVLENEVISYNGLQVVGLDHMLADRKSFDMHASIDAPTIKETLASLDIDKEAPSLMLHHSPNGVEYANQAGIDLYLAGHTHAGQLFPFNYLANLIFDYNRGLHDHNGTKIFVSEGIGTFGPPMRIGTKSEIVVVNMKAE